MQSISIRSLSRLMAFCLGISLVGTGWMSAGEAQTLSPGNEKDRGALPALLLIDHWDNGQGLRVRPVNPLTLTDLPGYSPIDLKQNFEYVFSPDGRILAVIIEYNGGAVLHLVDMTTWTDTMTDVKPGDSVTGLTFSPDGQMLYWIQPTRWKPYGGGYYIVDYVLRRYDLTKKEVTTMTALPTLFQPWYRGEHLISQERRLVLYGVLRDSSFFNGTLPVAFHAYGIDLERGAMVSDVTFGGINLLSEERWGFRPGWTWDRDGHRLYVVHADVDRVTVIDLIQSRVLRQANVRPRFSWIRQLWHSLTLPAEAKMPDKAERYVALSPDGKRLYITGLRREEQQGNTPWEYREIPLGLQIIATDDLTEETRMDLPVTHLNLSPDGRWLLLTGTYFDDQKNLRDSGLYIVDTQQLKQRAHLQPGSDSWSLRFSPDSRYAYVRRPAATGSNARVLQVLDLISQGVVAERIVEDSGAHLLVNAGAFPLVLSPTSVVDDANASRRPATFALFQNLPNPFNSRTVIRYDIAQAGHVRLAVYNTLGQKIRYLVNAVQALGSYTVHWDGQDERGRQVVTGIYLYRLQAGDTIVQTRKMLLLR